MQPEVIRRKRHKKTTILQYIYRLSQTKPNEMLYDCVEFGFGVHKSEVYVGVEWMARQFTLNRIINNI